MNRNTILGLVILLTAIAIIILSQGEARAAPSLAATQMVAGAPPGGKALGRVNVLEMECPALVSTDCDGGPCPAAEIGEGLAYATLVVWNGHVSADAGPTVNSETVCLGAQDVNGTSKCWPLCSSGCPSTTWSGDVKNGVKHCVTRGATPARIKVEVGSGK